MSSVSLDCYLIVKAALSSSGHCVTGTPSVRVQKGKPRTDANEVAIKVKLNLPLSLFQRPQLLATITVPDDKAPPIISADIRDNIAQAIRKQSGFDVRLIVESD